MLYAIYRGDNFFLNLGLVFCCHCLLWVSQGVPSRTGSPRVLGIYSLAPFVMFTLLVYLETHNQYPLLCVVAVGKWYKKRKKLADDKEGRGQSKAYILMHYCFISDWSKQSKNHVRRFELSRLTVLMRGKGSTVLYCKMWIDSETWSVSQGSECLWIQVARA